MQCNRSLLLIARPQINSNIHGLIITNEEVALIATATRLYKYLYSLRFCVEGKARFIHATCVQYITNESGEAREMVEPKWNCIILLPIDKRAKCANLERCGYLNVYLWANQPRKSATRPRVPFSWAGLYGFVWTFIRTWANFSKRQMRTELAIGNYSGQMSSDFGGWCESDEAVLKDGRRSVSGKEYRRAKADMRREVLSLGHALA